MGLFGKSKEDKERKEIKKGVDKIMNEYAKGKLSSDDYMKKMMDFTTSHSKKKK